LVSIGKAKPRKGGFDLADFDQRKMATLTRRGGASSSLTLKSARLQINDWEESKPQVEPGATTRGYRIYGSLSFSAKDAAGAVYTIRSSFGFIPTPQDNGYDPCRRD